MKLLLTGGTGFLGRNLLLRLIREHKKYETIYLPLRNPEKLREQLKQEGYDSLPANFVPIKAEAPSWDFEPIEADHVIYAAGTLFAQDDPGYYLCNVDGTLNFFSRLRKPTKIVVLSSQAAAGPCGPNESAKNEHDSNNPVTGYGRSKLAMEKQLKEKFSHLPYLCLRPPMVLGARDSATLPLFKMAKQPVQFKPGSSLKYYSYIGVNDLVRAILTCLDSSTPWADSALRYYFVANPGAITDRELISTAVEATGRKPRLIAVPIPFIKMASRVIDAIPPWRRAVPTLSRDRAQEIWPDRWVVSSQAFMKNFGWRAEESLDEILRSTYEWYESQGLV